MVRNAATDITVVLITLITVEVSIGNTQPHGVHLWYQRSYIVRALQNPNSKPKSITEVFQLPRRGRPRSTVWTVYTRYVLTRSSDLRSTITNSAFVLPLHGDLLTYVDRGGSAYGCPRDPNIQ